MNKIASNIKRIAKEKGVTMEKLAEQLGITPPSISRIIQGNPKLSSLEKLADLLECDVSDFFIKKEYKPEKTPTAPVSPMAREEVYGFLRIGERIVEINGIQDLREALVTCEVNYL